MNLYEPLYFYTDDFMFDVMGIETLPTRLYQYTSVNIGCVRFQAKFLKWQFLQFHFRFGARCGHSVMRPIAEMEP